MSSKENDSAAVKDVKLNIFQEWKKKHTRNQHKYRYLIVDSGYTSRLVRHNNEDEDEHGEQQPHFEMDLVTTNTDKANQFNSKIWETSMLKALTEYHDKLRITVAEQKDEKIVRTKTEEGMPVLVLDSLWGQGLYVNPKARAVDVLFILDALKNEKGYDNGVVAFTDFEDAYAIMSSLKELDYCAWYKGEGDYVYRVNYGDFDLGYAHPDTESG